MNWISKPLYEWADIAITGQMEVGGNLVPATRDLLRQYWQTLTVFRPDEVPAGALYARLTRVEFSVGHNTHIVSVMQTMGDGTPYHPPIPFNNVGLVEGWQGEGAPVLPAPDTAPMGGQPGGRPMTGRVFFTETDGRVEVSWGQHDSGDPNTTRLAHWTYVFRGPSGIYTDVLDSVGWRWGTEHEHPNEWFVLASIEEPPPPPPPGPSLPTEEIALRINEIAGLFFQLADLFRQ